VFAWFRCCYSCCNTPVLTLLLLLLLLLPLLLLLLQQLSAAVGGCCKPAVAQLTCPSTDKLLPCRGDAAVMYARPYIFSLAAPCSSMVKA
jgi:hypothetical protein